MTSAQVWVSIFLLFVLGEQAIVTWGNRARLLKQGDSGRALKEGGDK